MTSSIALFVTFIALFYKGFAFYNLVEGPCIGFAGREMPSVKMKGPEVLRAGFMRFKLRLEF